MLFEELRPLPKVNLIDLQPVKSRVHEAIKVHNLIDFLIINLLYIFFKSIKISSSFVLIIIA